MGATVLLVHCLTIKKWHFLSPIRRATPTPGEAASTGLPTDQTPLLRPATLLRRIQSRNSIASNSSTRTTDPWRNSLPQDYLFDKWAQPQSATRLGLPSRPRPDLETLDFIAILDSCKECSPCLVTPPSIRLYAFTNTQYVGIPGICFTKKDKWHRAVRWAKNGGKWVQVLFWTWEGRKVVANIGFAEDGGIEVMGLEGMLEVIGKGKHKA